jgi:hypothetical protein
MKNSCTYSLSRSEKTDRPEKNEKFIIGAFIVEISVLAQIASSATIVQQGKRSTRKEAIIKNVVPTCIRPSVVGWRLGRLSGQVRERKIVREVLATYMSLNLRVALSTYLSLTALLALSFSTQKQ